VTVVEYTEKSQYFKIPDTLSSPVGYKPWVYIGPDSLIDKFYL
jgi:hypothetical protein